MDGGLEDGFELWVGNDVIIRLRILGDLRKGLRKRIVRNNGRRFGTSYFLFGFNQFFLPFATLWPAGTVIWGMAECTLEEFKFVFRDIAVLHKMWERASWTGGSLLAVILKMAEILAFLTLVN